MADGRKRWSGIERQLRATHGPLLAGVDEVGRGPLAGPVVACAVIMPPDRRAIAGVDDSKRVSEPDRVRLARKIRESAIAIGVGAASVREIDTYNIYHASSRAIRRAVSRLSQRPDHVVLDGNPIRTLGIEHTAVVHGDARCYAIACASIIAKVIRDGLMRRLAVRYPAYGWERNCGYATLEHISVVDSIGSTPHHRTSFRNRQQLELLFEEELAENGLVGGYVGELPAQSVLQA
jgi:ribonuclease HII